MKGNIKMTRVYEEFHNQKDAMQFKDDYLNRYHPSGYGTSLSVWPKRDEGLWVVSGSRFVSCD